MSDTPGRDATRSGAPTDTPASPYGPHPRGVDEAAGGADSSPYETEPTGARKDKADAAHAAGRDRGDEVNELP